MCLGEEDVGNLDKGTKDGYGCRSRSVGYSLPERGWMGKEKRWAGEGALGSTHFERTQKEAEKGAARRRWYRPPCRPWFPHQV